MRFGFVVGLLLFLSLAGAAKGQQSNHNAYDVALHLQHCTKRPVFFVLSVAEQLTADSLPPCEKGPLDNWLSPRKVKLIWTDSVILLRNIPVPFYTSAQGEPFLAPEERWTNLLLKVSVRKPNQDELRQQNDSPDHYKYFAVRRDLNEQELTDTGNWVLENVPMPPSLPPMLCKACGLPPETVSFHLEIVLEAVKLNADGPEQIVGSIRTQTMMALFLGSAEYFCSKRRTDDYVFDGYRLCCARSIKEFLTWTLMRTVRSRSGPHQVTWLVTERHGRSLSLIRQFANSLEQLEIANSQ